MSYTYIITSLQGKIAQLTLNRPSKHNALCIDMVKELNHYFSSLLGNENIQGLFIQGNDKAFCAGGDLKEMQMLSQDEAQKRSQYVQSTFRLMERLPFPVLCFVRGICLGGGLELVLHSDGCVCTEDTQMGLPEVKYGMIPGAGGVTILPERMGAMDAKYFLLSGENIPLSKAFNTGLVQKVILTSEYNEEWNHQSDYFNSANPASLKAIKSITQMRNMENIEDIYAAESEQFASLLFNNGRGGIDKNFTNKKD